LPAGTGQTCQISLSCAKCNKPGFVSSWLAKKIYLALFSPLFGTVWLFIEIVIWQPWDKLPNKRAVCFTVGLYYVAITWQQIFYVYFKLQYYTFCHM